MRAEPEEAEPVVAPINEAKAESGVDRLDSKVGKEVEDEEVEEDDDDVAAAAPFRLRGVVVGLRLIVVSDAVCVCVCDRVLNAAVERGWLRREEKGVESK